ncbi:MAG TPA: leucyl aminopeptidase, partial [Planctomycetota bacterium]|nr:leucyl aminopeptidase [Planctomycetota bacterium]
MKIRILPDGAAPPRTDLIACLVLDGDRAAPHPELARVWSGARATGDVQSDFRKVRLFHTGDKRWPRLMTVGLGKPDEVTSERVRRAAALAQSHAENAGVRTFLLAAGRVPSAVGAEAFGRAVAEGLVLGAYRYVPPGKKQRDERSAQEAQVLVRDRGHAEVERGFAAGRVAAAGTVFARDLANGPGNLVTPERLAREARRLARGGVRVRVYERADLRRFGMGAFLGVAQGSEQPPKLIVLQWDGGRGRQGGARDTLVVVGKGLTFDSGGISIKPAAKMDEMRYDMCGAAAVLGLFHAIAAGALARARRKVRVVGVIPATENMPGSSAQRPGDVVTACDGTTIEVLNTDAEGRLVLADAIAWAKKTFAPKAIVDLATLTGAVVVALGHEIGAILGNDDALVGQLTAAGKACDEPLWQLPLWEVHKNLIKSKYADVANLPSAAAGAGTIAGAAFLAHFAGKTPWVHLDIAGTA